MMLILMMQWIWMCFAICQNLLIMTVFFRALNTAINYYHSNTQIITIEYYDEYYSVFTNDIVYITIEERKAVIITQQKKYYTNKKIELLERKN